MSMIFCPRNSRLLLFLALCLVPLFRMSASPAVEEYNAALPEPFVAILYARHSGDFYDQQAREWEAVATGECSTDEAWWHYYKTAHYSNRFGSGDHDLKAILAAAEKQLDPEGFELNYLRFVDDPDPTTRPRRSDGIQLQPVDVRSCQRRPDHPRRFGYLPELDSAVGLQYSARRQRRQLPPVAWF